VPELLHAPPNLVVKHSPDKRRVNRGEKEPGEKFRI